MKKALSTILAFVCLAALMFGGAENPDGSCNLLWTLGCLAGAAVCIWASSKLDKKEDNVQ